MSRARQLVLLGGAIIAFAGMTILVWYGVSSRRQRRDVLFGIERVVALTDQGRISEAAELLPVIASSVRREQDARTLVSVTMDIREFRHGASETAAAMAALAIRFPENGLVIRAAALTLVEAGNAESAVEITRAAEQVDVDLASAYALIASGSPRLPEDERTTWPHRLVGLTSESGAEEYLAAYEATSEARYAQNALLVHLLENESESAEEVLNGVGLDRLDVELAAGVLVDRAHYERAISLLERSDSSMAQQRLLADALMFSGMSARARSVHEILTNDPEVADRAAINLIWTATEIDAADALASLQDEFPRSWPVARASVAAGVPNSRQTLSRWTDGPDGDEARALLLATDEDPDRRGFPALVWTSVSEDPGAGIERYAAWYFHSRRLYDDLTTLLERSDAEGEAWAETYLGLISAETDDWATAHRHFEHAHSLSPDWWTALNLTISWHRIGEAQYGRAMLDRAIEIASLSTDIRSVAALTTGAVASASISTRRELAEGAIAMDPDNAEAALILRQLELGGVR